MTVSGTVRVIERALMEVMLMVTVGMSLTVPLTGRERGVMVESVMGRAVSLMSAGLLTVRLTVLAMALVRVTASGLMTVSLTVPLVSVTVLVIVSGPVMASLTVVVMVLVMVVRMVVLTVSLSLSLTVSLTVFVWALLRVIARARAGVMVMRMVVDGGTVLLKVPVAVSLMASVPKEDSGFLAP